MGGRRDFQASCRPWLSRSFSRETLGLIVMSFHQDKMCLNPKAASFFATKHFQRKGHDAPHIVLPTAEQFDARDGGFALIS
jgi:hypothetical protein